MRRRMAAKQALSVPYGSAEARKRRSRARDILDRQKIRACHLNEDGCRSRAQKPGADC